MSEPFPQSPETSQPPLPEELARLGDKIAQIAGVDTTAIVQEHQVYADNPNTVGKGFFVGAGEVPMDADHAYRQVGIEAVQDLAESGIVRNGATARDELHDRWGHRVFWHQGADDKKIATGGRFILEAPIKATGAGWVEASQLKGVHTKLPDGSVVNLLDRQPPKA